MSYDSVHDRRGHVAGIMINNGSRIGNPDDGEVGGQTIRKIAETLVISRQTVAGHLHPAMRKLRVSSRVLARSPSAQPTSVRAVVTSNWHGTSSERIKTVVASRILVVRRVWETVKIARGAPRPMNPDWLLRPGNVISTSRTVRTTDLKDHLLVVHVPSGLASRDYFVVGVQTFTEQCRPRGTGQESSLIGLIRITSS